MLVPTTCLLMEFHSGQWIILSRERLPFPPPSFPHLPIVLSVVLRPPGLSLSNLAYPLVSFLSAHSCGPMLVRITGGASDDTSRENLSSLIYLLPIHYSSLTTQLALGNESNYKIQPGNDTCSWLNQLFIGLLYVFCLFMWFLNLFDTHNNGHVSQPSTRAHMWFILPFSLCSLWTLKILSGNLIFLPYHIPFWYYQYQKALSTWVLNDHANHVND